MLGQYLGAGSSVTRGLYHLDGVATDSSGNGNNGTATNVTWVGGKVGSGAASFNGSSSKINMGNVNTQTGNSAFSISFNIKYSQGASSGFIVAKIGNVNYKGYAVYHDSGTQKINLLLARNPEGQYCGVRLPTLINDGIWHNVVFTYNGDKNPNNIKGYIDGFKKTLEITNNNLTLDIDTTDNFCIGCRNSVDLFLNGICDEVIIENRIPTEIEIKKQYTYSQGKFGIL